MVSKKLIIKNEAGLHARPASVLAREATLCDCDVMIKVGEKTIVVKSVLNIMAAVIKKGAEIELVCDGPDEVTSLERLSALIESGLGDI